MVVHFCVVFVPEEIRKYANYIKSQFVMVTHAFTCVFVHAANYISNIIICLYKWWWCWYIPGVIKGVPFSRAGIATVGCVMTAHSGAWVVGHCIQVVHCIYYNRTETRNKKAEVLFFTQISQINSKIWYFRITDVFTSLHNIFDLWYDNCITVKVEKDWNSKKQYAGWGGWATQVGRTENDQFRNK